MKNIDFRNGQPLIMMVSQYDYGYDLQIALWSNGTPITITAAEIVSENFTVACTFSGNVVTIPVGTSMTERFGHFPAELRVTDSTGQVSSKNFDFFVERSPLAVKSTETYSGDIVEFTAKRVPLNSVVVTMEPIQDLNGYDSPWPAGGNKNLIPYPYSAEAQTIISSGTWNGMTIAENNGKISVKGTQNDTNLCIFAFFKLKANTTYTFSTNYQYANDSTTMYCTIYDPTKAKLYANPKTATPVTFTTTEECTVRIYLNPATSDNGRSFDFTIQPQLEEGSSASEWTPYSNICPISGRTGASVVVSGENLIGEMENGYIASNGHEISPISSKHEMVSEFIPVEEGVDYIYEYVPVNVTSTTWTGYCFYSAADMSALVGSRVITEEADAITITPPSGAKYIRIGSRFLQNGGTAEFRVKTTYPITFTSAGTVYAGTVDLVSGELVVTHGMYTFASASDIYQWSTASTGAFSITSQTITDAPVVGSMSMISNQYKKCVSTVPAATEYAMQSVTGRIVIYDPRFTSRDVAEQLIAANQIQVLYPLATPLTYTLTPVQVMSLLGENVVWSPDGGVTVVVPEYY